jgi:uncharacterized protein
MWEWDEAKRATNVAKHGIDFRSVENFDWAQADVIEDKRKDYGEIRFEATGLIGARLHKLVFTMRSGRRRVISLRKANSQEIEKWLSSKTREAER